MILKLAAVCEAVRERPDGRYDLIGIFNELSAPGFPARQPAMTAIFVIQWEPGEGGIQPLRAELVLEQTGEKVLTIQGHTEVDERGTDRAPPVSPLIVPMENITFKVPGRYRFDLVAGGDSVVACSFFVGQVQDRAG